VLPLHHTLDALTSSCPFRALQMPWMFCMQQMLRVYRACRACWQCLAMFAVMVLLTPAVWHYCLAVLLPCRGGLQWSSGQRGQLGQQCAQGVTSHICCHSCRWRGSCCGSWQHILRGFDCWGLGGGVGQAGEWVASSTWPDSSGWNGSSSIIRAA
jgi:hypothetical protein